MKVIRPLFRPKLRRTNYGNRTYLTVIIQIPLLFRKRGNIDSSMVNIDFTMLYIFLSNTQSKLVMQCTGIEKNDSTFVAEEVQNPSPDHTSTVIICFKVCGI